MGGMATLDDELGPGRAAQSAIYRAGVSGRMPRVPVRWPELIAKAERSMTAEAWAYVHGSAGLETTADANATSILRASPSDFPGASTTAGT